MKTNNLLIVAIGFTFLMLTSCEPAVVFGTLGEGSSCEGDDIHLGDLTVKQATNNLLPSNALTKGLVLVNEEGDKITLDNPKQSEIKNIHLRIEAICGSMEGFLDNVYSYYNTSDINESYSNENEYSLYISKSIEVVEESLPEEFVYDFVSIGGRFGDTQFGRIRMISSLRGKDDNFPEHLLAPDHPMYIAGNAYDFDEQIELGGKTYENVISSLTDFDYINGKIYLTKEEGVIGVLDKDDVFWKLQ